MSDLLSLVLRRMGSRDAFSIHGKRDDGSPVHVDRVNEERDSDLPRREKRDQEWGELRKGKCQEGREGGETDWDRDGGEGGLGAEI